MIGKRIQEAMNEQIKHELESAYLYLAMAAYFEDEGLDGMAQWMKVQAMEESVHAYKFFTNIAERGGRVELLALKKPQKTWTSALAAFKAAYEHEQFITSKIHELVALAEKEKDYASMPMLQWFVEEQIEEEDTASKIADTLEKVGKGGHGLIMMDRELARRSFKIDPAVAALFGAGGE